ncbi:acylneuraminate cytidylyltransferase family protein [Halomonas sp. PAMB 3264]|uniref:acylneuraminate cytidylyltransferase family protein n=1 Tax=Halomonas sp. PAMB 3264 TaxID=3075222 RepID=UPI002898C2E9|nr:acylneuraminate cytidylyltransferase family protein [Halomonas sp. PAMB 3264]WNL41789.1 acylneuraminate cytidylyltransferase family protein [Halomonas sp. PAMB 3264]
MREEIKRIGTLAIIPARKDSKRLPRKNVLALAGKPLINWSIDEALKTQLVDLVVVTSDDEEVISIAKAYQSPRVEIIQRPIELATDTAKSVDVVIHALIEMEARGVWPERVVLLQPTSPLRTESDIEGAVRLFVEMRADNIVSVCEVDHPTAWCGKVDENLGLVGIDLSVSRSQEAEKEYRLNGAIYIVTPYTLKEQRQLVTSSAKVFMMDKRRSLDIDDIFDFKQCEFFLNYL